LNTREQALGLWKPSKHALAQSTMKRLTNGTRMPVAVMERHVLLLIGKTSPLSDRLDDCDNLLDHASRHRDSIISHLN